MRGWRFGAGAFAARHQRPIGTTDARPQCRGRLGR